jgi:hypothetical protein
MCERRASELKSSILIINVGEPTLRWIFVVHHLGHWEEIKAYLEPSGTNVAAAACRTFFYKI